MGLWQGVMIRVKKVATALTALHQVCSHPNRNVKSPSGQAAQRDYEAAKPRPSDARRKELVAR